MLCRLIGRRGSIDTGVIYCDDNLARLARMPSESVDLIYLDPPFFSNQNYEVIWGDESEVRSFEDRWKGGMEHYIEWMRNRLVEMHRVLKPSGSLYLHCDPSASHYLKVALDGIFGIGQFRNEIIWKRTGAHSGTKGFGPVHDTILFYSKSNDFYWVPQRGRYDPEYVRTKFTMDDGDGRRYQPISLTPSGTRKGATGEPWRGIDPTARGYHWKYPPDRLEEMDAEGRIYWPAKQGGMPRLKFYLDEAPGMLLQDIWIDIPPVNARAAERLGYPTQKPEALIQRIIAASSKRGDVVLDPFCGCGTALAVAHRMRREWIGIDISLTAAKLMLWRMDKLGAPALVEGLPKTEADLKRLKPFEFQNWAISRFNGTHATRKSNDFGVDGYSFLEHLPIQVKQSDKVGRVAIDNFQTAIKRERKHKGYVVAFSFTRNAYEEVARAKRHENIEIVLVPVSALLEDPSRLVSDATVPPAETGQLVHDLLPTAPAADALPTAEELFASASGRAG